MTEAEWLACDDPEAMLRHRFPNRRGRRTRRLFAAACCRSAFSLLDEECRRILDEAERYADKATPDEEAAASTEAYGPWADHMAGRNSRVLSYSFGLRAVLAARAAGWGEGSINAARVIANSTDEDNPAFLHERSFQCWLLRDIIGNPFRTPALSSTRCAATVQALAWAAYEEREMPDARLSTARLAVLSDALEEAGCADAEILTHLREPGPHVRGCWALDLLLGKE